MRTRSPCLQTSGVVYGPDRPLIVCQFQSMRNVSGIVELGGMKKFWKQSAKSRSTVGSYASLGCTTKNPTMPIVSCIA